MVMEKIREWIFGPFIPFKLLEREARLAQAKYDAQEFIDTVLLAAEQKEFTDPLEEARFIGLEVLSHLANRKYVPSNSLRDYYNGPLRKTADQLSLEEWHKFMPQIFKQVENKYKTGT